MYNLYDIFFFFFFFVSILEINIWLRWMIVVFDLRGMHSLFSIFVRISPASTFGMFNC